MEKEILTLGIESSCDETSAAVLRGGRTVLSNVISTQIPIHQKFGGVVPEIASRKHIVNIMPVIDEAVRQAGVTLTDIDQVAVTYGPGLVGALLVGVSAAKALAFALDKPLIGVNHLEGHIFANFLADPTLEPPFMALVVSGGHTALVDVRGYDTFHMMGQTRDDAAGEAFDKACRTRAARALMRWPRRATLSPSTSRAHSRRRATMSSASAASSRLFSITSTARR